MKRRYTKNRVLRATLIAVIATASGGSLWADGFPDLLDTTFPALILPANANAAKITADETNLSPAVYAISFATVYSNRDTIQRREHLAFLRQLDDQMDQAIHEKRREEAAWQAPRIQTSEPAGLWESSNPLPTSSSVAAAGPRATSASGSKIIKTAPRDIHGTGNRTELSSSVRAKVAVNVRIDYYSLRNGYIPGERSNQSLHSAALRLTSFVTSILTSRDARLSHVAFQSHFKLKSTRPRDFSIKSQAIGFLVFRGSDHAFIPA